MTGAAHSLCELPSTIIECDAGALARELALVEPRRGTDVVAVVELVAAAVVAVVVVVPAFFVAVVFFDDAVVFFVAVVFLVVPFF